MGRRGHGGGQSGTADMAKEGRATVGQSGTADMAKEGRVTVAMGASSQSRRRKDMTVVGLFNFRQ